VARSWNGTFLHERRFISYHGDRFKDVSLIIEDKRGRIVGVFPAALDPAREDRVISHAGLTYGGIVHAGHLRGTIMLDTLQAIVGTYRAMGLRFLRYKVVPHIYHKVISDDDLYALFRLGATRYRCDLSAAIDLESPRRPSQLRRRDLNKARKSGIQLTHGPRYLESYWAILEENLADKHGARPTHTLEEITDLQRRFPEQIECIVGTLENEVVAGVVMYNTSRVAHVQYSASSASGNSVGAQTAVMYHAIERSKLRSLRYFDFGISNERGGWMLNDGLYKFKTSFGASGIAHEFYELDLHAGCAA
jgi:hypothetical protein